MPHGTCVRCQWRGEELGAQSFNVSLAMIFALYRTTTLLMALKADAIGGMSGFAMLGSSHIHAHSRLDLLQISCDIILAASFLQETANTSTGHAAEPDPKRLKKCNDDSR